MVFLLIMEFLALAFIGRHVVQNDASPKTWSLIFASMFLVGDAVAGMSFLPTAVARMASIPLLFAHFAGIQRFSGLPYIGALLLGTTIPFCVSAIRGAVFDG